MSGLIFKIYMFLIFAAGHQPAADHILDPFEIFGLMVAWFNGSMVPWFHEGVAGDSKSPTAHTMHSQLPPLLILAF